MSKDKGSKNYKKAPADKSASTGKVQSDYKSEGKSKQPALDVTIHRPDVKPGGKVKNQ